MSSVVKTDGDVIRESNIPYEEGIVNRIKYSLKQIDSSENNQVHINAVTNDIKGDINIVNMGISHDKISTVLTLRASIGGNIKIAFSSEYNNNKINVVDNKSSGLFYLAF